jgi:hypothetical protein
VMKSNASADESKQPRSPIESKATPIQKEQSPAHSQILITGLFVFICVLTGYLFFISNSMKQTTKEISDQQTLITKISENLEEVNDILDVLNVADLQMITLQGSESEKNASGKIFYSTTMRTAVLQVANLPTQPEDKEYRLWMHGGRTMYLLHKFSINAHLTKDYLTRFELPEMVPKTAGNIFLVTLESIRSESEPEGKQYLVGIPSGKINR